MSSHALLLRLFQSEYFNSWMAITYLHRYSDNIGIQHYLCDRLKEFPIEQVQFLLPQLCHLIWTNPQAVAVETLILELCQKSSHFTLLTLWFSQSQWMDLKPSEKNTLKFHMCFKLLKKCQKILLKNEFDNPKLKLIQSATNNSTTLLDKGSSSKNLRLKVNENVVPAFLGMGMMLAGFGAPKLAIDSSKMAIIEGSKSLNAPQTNNVPQTSKKSTDGLDKEAESPLVSEGSTPLSPEIIKYVSPSLEELSMGRAFVGDRPWSRASHSREVSGKPSRAFQEAKESIEENQLSLSDSESQSVGMTRSPSSKRQTYYQSEIHFILSLMEISNRLCKVPKSSRQDSLQAELALLNYNLPADICLPLWCKATQHHHKVVRISPKDSVTLNSADRVPYLVFIEVFEENKGVEVEKSEEQKLPVPLPYSNSNSPNPNNQESSSPSRQNKNYFQKVLTRRSSNAQDEVAEHMRTAAIMLAQLAINSGPNNVAQKAKSNNQKMGINERIREKIIREMSQLEEKRIEQIIQQNEDLHKIMSNGGEGNENESVNENEVLLKCKYKDDPSADVFNEDWDAKRERIRLDSPYGDHPNWELIPLIVKTGADLRQEQFALQLIEEADRIWKEAGLDIFVKPFRIMVTSNSSGLIEMVRNTISVHSLKKNAYSKGYNTKGTVYSLYDHFVKEFGDPSSAEFLKAQDNFLKSLVGYSILSYILQLKDRHNGNVLVDKEGHIIHIDFGFMLSNSPGSVGFEMAPFKMTQEYLDILGGVNSTKYKQFVKLMKAGFKALRKHAENLIILVEIMQKDSQLPCFSKTGISTAQALRDRFGLNLIDSQLEEFIDGLVLSSCCNVFTRLYDTFQYYSNGIL